jgi:hypothetical protein
VKEWRYGFDDGHVDLSFPHIVKKCVRPLVPHFDANMGTLPPEAANELAQPLGSPALADPEPKALRRAPCSWKEGIVQLLSHSDHS